MQTWNDIFKEKGKVFKKPQKDMPKIASLFKKNHVKKVLDLGCGSGRHLVFLAKKGFTVYGFDSSPEALRLAKNWLAKEKIRAQLKKGSVYNKFPYATGFFDAVVCTQVINHGGISKVRKAIKEIERVLKPEGLLFLTVRRRMVGKNWEKGVLVEKRGFQKSDYMVIAPRTYAPIDGWEAGVPHYLFNRQLLRKEFGNFKILGIWVQNHKTHYCMLAQLK